MPTSAATRRFTVAIVTSVLGCAGSAFGAPSSQPYRLGYWAVGRCPDENEFARRIEAREPRLRGAREGESALGFYAELRELAGGASGRLTARTEDGREVVREVSGPSCDDVATALALIAAFAADPTHPQPAEPTSAVRPRAVASRPASRAAEDEEVDLARRAIDPALRWTFGVGGGLGFDSSIAPSPGYGLGVQFEAESKGGSAWRPLFAVSAMRAAAGNTETRAGNASFTWLAFRGAVCPLRWPQATPLFVRPCVFAEAGLLEGSVSLGARSQDRTSTWFAAGGFGRVEALVEEVLSFQLDGGVTTALKRDSYDAGPGSPSAFRVPRAGILGRIGLSFRFQ